MTTAVAVTVLVLAAGFTVFVMVVVGVTIFVEVVVVVPTGTSQVDMGICLDASEGMSQASVYNNSQRPTTLAVDLPIIEEQILEDDAGTTLHQGAGASHAGPLT